MKGYLEAGRGVVAAVFVSLAMLVLTAAPVASAAQTVCPGLPVAKSFKATGLGSTKATLNGSVSGAGGAFSYFFQYGTSIYLGQSTGVTGPFAAGAAAQFMPVSATITGLKPNTTYYFRLNATNSAATTFGALLKFTTPKSNATHDVRHSAAVVGAQASVVAAGPAGCPAFAPGAQSAAATNVGNKTATMNGSLETVSVPNPLGGFMTEPYTPYFQYGTTLYLGQQWPAAGPPPHQANLPMSAVVGFLKPNTTYYFRFVVAFSQSGNAFTPSGIVYGALLKFRTT